MCGHSAMHEVPASASMLFYLAVCSLILCQWQSAWDPEDNNILQKLKPILNS